MAAIVRGMYPMASSPVSITEIEENQFLESAISFARELKWSLDQRDLIVWILSVKLRKMSYQSPIDTAVVALFAETLMCTGRGHPAGKLSAERLPSVVQHKNMLYDLGYLLPRPEPAVVELVKVVLQKLILTTDAGPDLFAEGSILGNALDKSVWEPVLIKCMLMKSCQGAEMKWADKYISLGKSETHILINNPP